MNIEQFCAVVCDFYRMNQRSLPWRSPEADGTYDPYKILVSEFMLQQTQVVRVISKYTDFMSRFPTIDVLARAPLAQVLTAWSGLGYNRRAQWLHEAAKTVQDTYSGTIPSNQQELVSLKGVGENTAAAIRAYAFNEPVVFIETNIRSVFLHHFFSDKTDISDQQLLPYIEQAVMSKMNTLKPREWYWALMDYGVYLKSTHANPSRRSKHHSFQSKFAGSRREVRGAILRALADGPLTFEQLYEATPTKSYLASVLEQLAEEKLITQNNTLYYLGDAIL